MSVDSDASARLGDRKEDTRLAGLRDLDGRDVAALTEPMNVYADDPEAGLDEVAVYHRGDRKIVNAEAGYWTCEDWHFRQPDGGCKHQRRVAFRRGDREVPAAVDRAALDDPLR